MDLDDEQRLTVFVIYAKTLIEPHDKNVTRCAFFRWLHRAVLFQRPVFGQHMPFGQNNPFFCTTAAVSLSAPSTKSQDGEDMARFEKVFPVMEARVRQRRFNLEVGLTDEDVDVGGEGMTRKGGRGGVVLCEAGGTGLR